MRQQKHKSIKILLGLALLIGLNLQVSAQLLPGYLSGQATIGENPTLLYGNLTIGSSGELFLGTHLPRLQQINTLFLIGNYTGETGAKTYHSVINNSNDFGTRGFVDIVGTASGSTEIMLDLFNGWDGSCIDLARAHNAGSDINAFVMQEANYNGHTAYLKSRIYGNDRIWFLAERMIVAQYLFPNGQSRCLNDLTPFDELTVQTAATGNYLYQWYKSPNPDGSNAIPVGSANGGQTASYRPIITTDTTFYYFCIVRSANCPEYNIDTTDVSGAITVYGEPRIHIYGANLCIGENWLFTAEIYEGDTTGTGYWHISEGLSASINDTTGLVTAHSTGRFTVTYHYTTPNGCSTFVTSQEYEVFAKPVSEVQDIILCSPQTIPASSLIVNLINADTYKIYDSDGVTEITGQNIQATYGTKTYYVEAINTDCHCVTERVAVHVTVTDIITFDLPAQAILCQGELTVDLASLVTNVNITDYSIEVYNANNVLLAGTIVTASNQLYYVKVVANGCSSDSKGIMVVVGNDNVQILQQPTIQVYNPDDLDGFVNFYVVAEGASSYQWYKIENGVSTALVGETNPLLSIPVTDINPNISYYVVVTGGCGSNVINITSDIVYAEVCLPIIIQKKNHTLVVDNNSHNNGGYTFVYYEWYKNNQLIHQGAHGSDLGGMYNTGGSNLNPSDSYYVIVTDQYGKKHRSCTYNPIIYISGTRIIAYPNPVNVTSSLIVVDVETDDEELLANGVITSYNVLGQYLGQVRTNGHRITPVQLPLVAGVYVLRFTSGDFSQDIKIIIQ